LELFSGDNLLNYINRAREVIDVEIEGLQKVSLGLDEQFQRAIELMQTAVEKGGKVVVTGVGKNLPIGQKIAATLTSTGSPAVLLHPTDAMHGELGIISEGDVVLALSYSGESDELRELIPAIKRKEVSIIALTCSRENFLAHYSDCVILVGIDREACPFNMAPTASTTATLAMGDALAMVLLDARGFKKEDYAKLHPGGAIGRTLLMKVSDIMRKDNRIASVKSGQTVQDAVLAMTEARSGSVVVVDDAQRVLGIFTDGDLRRHLNKPELPKARIESLMSPHPITLRDDQLAVEVLAVFEKHNVDDLIVVDQNNRLAGMIDIQDLPKFKIL
jgi:arabinose-5-phosphate isomerase